ncbi:MAG TPA: hypothetical protein VF085_00655 [Solirubrobacterales bacterium]
MNSPVEQRGTSILFICGSGVVSQQGGDAFGGALVMFADESAAAGLEVDATLRARLDAALDGGLGLAWVQEGGDAIAVPYDEGGLVARDVTLVNGLRIPRGSVVERADPGAVTIRCPGDLVLWLALEGPESGALRYTARAEPDASIRYFYAGAQPGPGSASTGGAAGDAATLGALRFALFEPSGVELDVRFDPARPYDPRASRAVPLAAEPQPSTFRTRWGATIVLTPRPPESAYVYAFDPVLNAAYLTLDGVWDWALAEAESAPIDLVPGTFGVEYVRGPAGFAISFVAGSPAFAPEFAPQPVTTEAVTPFPLSSQIPGSTGPPVTTAWVYVLPVPNGEAAREGEDAAYFSEAERAPWLIAQVGEPFLGGLELESRALPPAPASPASFPAAPYAGLETPPAASGEWLEVARRFETEVLTPARTETIAALQPAPRRSRAELTEPVVAVTPQGLLATFSPDREEWRSLVLAQAEDGAERLQYTAIRDELRKALLATELFLVVSDAKLLYEHCSTTFCIGDETLTLAEAASVPKEALAEVASLRDRVFQTGSELASALEQALDPANRKYASTIELYAELARLTIAGWTFDLASWRWAKGAEPTILVIDFAEGSFSSLVDDISRWTLPTEFNADGGIAAQERLQAIVAAATEADRDPQLAPFVETVLATGAAAWNGVIYFDAAVPAQSFPPELKVLAAGMEEELRAHHVGVTLSPFEIDAGAIELADSSLFGLILYEDEADLVYKGDAYDYKVLSLKVRFANSTIAAFSSEAELLVGRLFGELAQLDVPGRRGPNNIVLEGTLQNGVYRFASAQRSHYVVKSEVVGFVTVQSAELVTLPDSTPEWVSSRFVLDGSMGFRSLEELDLFGFGSEQPASDAGLAFSNLLVTMGFDPYEPSRTRKLEFVAGQALLDPSRSQAREGSLPRRFPLQAAAIREGTTASGSSPGEAPSKAATPADLGFIPVESPLEAGALGGRWFGLELTLSFGDPGGLAAQAGFSGAILASWSPSESGYDVAIGLRLPGSSGGRKSLTIMGPLNLSIGRLSLLRDAETSDYLLLLQNIALSFLGLSFPPGGQASAALFGNPDPEAAATTLGWYAAYVKNEEKKELSWRR